MTELVLLPGLGLGAESWRPTQQALGRPSRVIGLPGYGVRAARRHDLAPRALAEELVASDLLPDGPLVLAGHSASCQVAAHAARLLGDRVTGLVLVGPTTDPDAARWPRMLETWVHTALNERARQLPVLLRQWSRTGFGVMRRAMDAARGDRIDRVLADVRCPVLVLRGRNDVICRRGWAMELARRPGRRARTNVVTLAAGAHLVPLTHGDLVAESISTFVSGLDQSDRAQRRTHSA